MAKPLGLVSLAAAPEPPTTALPLFCNGNQPNPGNVTQQPEAQGTPEGTGGGGRGMQMLCCATSLAKVDRGLLKRVESISVL